MRINMGLLLLLLAWAGSCLCELCVLLQVLPALLVVVCPLSHNIPANATGAEECRNDDPPAQYNYSHVFSTARDSGVAFSGQECRVLLCLACSTFEGNTLVLRLRLCALQTYLATAGVCMPRTMPCSHLSRECGHPTHMAGEQQQKPKQQQQVEPSCSTDPT